MEKIEAPAIESNKRWEVNKYYEMTTFTVLVCNKERVHEIFLKSKLQIM